MLSYISILSYIEGVDRAEPYIIARIFMMGSKYDPRRKIWIRTQSDSTQNMIALMIEMRTKYECNLNS